MTFEGSQPPGIVDAEQIREQVRAEEEAHPPKERVERDPITPEYVRQCLIANELGDGSLYRELMRDRYVFVKASQSWLVWRDHHWDIDKMDEHIQAVEKVALRYGKEADELAKPIERAQESLSIAGKKLRQAEEIQKIAVKGDDQAKIAAAKTEVTRAEAEKKDAERRLYSLTEERKALTRRVERLRSLRGARNCAEYSHCVEDPLAIIGDEIDQQPLLLPCVNGVIDMRTGRLRDGRPRDYLVKAVPVLWPVNHKGLDDYLAGDPGAPSPCPIFEHQFLPSVFEDPEIEEFICRLMGYASTGLTLEQFIIVAAGEGRNGKGIFFEEVHGTLGELAWIIQPELILEQKNARSSNGASPDIVALQGRRIVIASETDENRRISASRVKQLTGGDTLNGRLLYDKFETNFTPTHTLFLQTNPIPGGLTKDFALLKRLLLVRFPFMFVDDPAAEALKKPAMRDFFKKRDVHLKAKLRGERDSGGILAWLMKGCLQWQKMGGLHPPDLVRADIEELRQSEDVLEQFIESWCERDELDNYGSMFKDIYGAFKEWYAEHVDDSKDPRYLPSKKTVTKQLEKKGFQKFTRGGQTWFLGLRVRQGVLS